MFSTAITLSARTVTGGLVLEWERVGWSRSTFR